MPNVVSGSRPRGVRRARRALALLAALLLLLAACEGLLAWRGLAPRPTTATVVARDAASVTIDLWGRAGRQNELTLARRAQPGVRRVVLVGASTVQGYFLSPRSTIPRFLEPLLDAALEGRHEVVRLGVPGFAIDEVRRASELVLRELAPDLLVVYSGHNEFVEPNAARAVERMRDPWRGRLRRALAATRSGRWLLQRAGAERPPLLVRHRMHSGGGVLERATVGPLAHLVHANYERQLEALVEAARAAGVPLLVVMPVANGRGFGPLASAFHRELAQEERARFQALIEEAAGALARGELDAAEAVLDAAAAIDAGVAELHHLRSRSAWRRGDEEAARRHDHRKWALDEIPLVASAEIRARIEAVCARTGTPLADPTRALERIPAPDEPPLFLDELHPSPYGQYLIAREIARAAAAARLLGVPRVESPEPSYEQLCARLELDAAWLASTERIEALGLVNHACFALDPAPYVERARAILERTPERERRKTSLVEADVLLAVLEGKRQRLVRLGDLERHLGQGAYERVVKAIEHQPNLGAGLARAGFRVEEGRIVDAGRKGARPERAAR